MGGSVTTVLEDIAYKTLKSLSRTAESQAPHISPTEWKEANERVRALRAQGKRLDGAPARASVYGVRPKSETATEEDKTRQRNDLMAALAAYRAATKEEGNDEAGSNGQAYDGGKSQGGPDEADRKAGGDGVCAKAPGRDRKRGNEDRGAEKAAGACRAARTDGKKGGPRGKGLNREQQEEFYREYSTTDRTMPEMCEKWGIGESAGWRYVKDARLRGGGKAEKPKRSKRTLRITDDEIRELARRRREGESSADLAAEYNVSRYVIRTEIKRVCGPSRYVRELTAEEKRQIVAQYLRGDIAADIKATWRIGQSTLNNVIIEAGAPLRDAEPARTPGSMMPWVAQDIAFPRLAGWMVEFGYNIQTLADEIEVKATTLYRWLREDAGDHMTKGAIDKLIALTGIDYPVLFREKEREKADETENQPGAEA